ncbi:hypothetical protein EYR41_003204 [Orbilia oligospora]|uniref:Uncharacterized protein n=1 Tax=Orbilia oligospora TaxID=2813651 RepID=A0A7C8KD76_ORBOL|nr:hypothetical protein TWF751_007687 [Orbilia oligospora]KAF3295345.1 hypothetical protein TWF132_002034 [Orbilia oligospora]TGJ71221.1 hypothetical protein EYR41_003204 [Orbilia oligospora]
MTEFPPKHGNYNLNLNLTTYISPPPPPPSPSPSPPSLPPSPPSPSPSPSSPMMTSVAWRSDLLTALAERDIREKSQVSIILEYSRLADRTAILTSPPITSTPPTDQEPSKTSSDIQALYATIATLRTDLATSQKDRTNLQTQLTTATNSLTLLQKSSSANLRELDKVKVERYHLEQKVKSKDDDSKLNRKMIENLQDEIIALNIQLNIGEQAKMRLKSENEELISRWMALKKDEAEAMNNNSKYS